MTTTTKPLFTDIQRRRIVTKTLAAVRKHGWKHFDMSDWIKSVETDEYNSESADLDEIVEDVCGINISDCGTTACLAGHMALALSETDRRKVESQGRRAELVLLRDVLGGQGRPGGRLVRDWDWSSPFSSGAHNWPKTMQDAYTAAQNDDTDDSDHQTRNEWVAAIAYLENWLDANPA
jgi:hypothetical protein